MIRIFIESGVQQSAKRGKGTTNEQNFIEEFIAYHFPKVVKNSDFEVIGIGGKDALEMTVLPFKDNMVNGEQNILLFDADSPANGGGFIFRREELRKKAKELNIEFNLFLWPDNGRDGDFETLLLDMVNQEHKCLLKCFEGFEKCIRGNDPEELKYESPDRKAAIYTYINSFKKSKKESNDIKSGIWLFDHDEYWDLNAKAAHPLKEFLVTYFKT